MRMKKNKVLILAMAMLLLTLSGCGKKPKVEMVESGKNFYKEYYDPEKKHREEEIILEEACTEIEVQGTTTSGTIQVTIIDKAEPDIIYKYVVDGSLSETIKVEKNHVHDQWILCTDINEETEGSLCLLFH